MIECATLRDACKSLAGDMAEFLMRLGQFESISGYEGPAMDWVYQQFKDITDECERIPVPESIVVDPEYQFRLDGRSYEGRPNVRCVVKGDGGGKSALFYAHVDVVPPSHGQVRPFDPYIEDGCMYGRGVQDDKGQVAALWTMLTAMKRLGIRPKGDIIIHLVIEEETGGNGALALIRNGEVQPDCAVICESASNNVAVSVRGAVWFRGIIYGRAGHSGSAGTTVSALTMAVEAMRIIEEYHDELLAATIDDDPLFAVHKNPMPVTFGELHAGDWPAMAPQKAEFSGVFGFLTTPKAEVMHEIEHRVRTRGPEWLADPTHFEIEFMYHHDTMQQDPDHPAVQTLLSCFHDFGIESKLEGKTASSDTIFYRDLLDVPTMLTGCGKPNSPHTANEHINLAGLNEEAAVLLHFVQRWCGCVKRG